jgi:hypothetical protein
MAVLAAKVLLFSFDFFLGSDVEWGGMGLLFVVKVPDTTPPPSLISSLSWAFRVRFDHSCSTTCTVLPIVDPDPDTQGLWVQSEYFLLLILGVTK